MQCQLKIASKETALSLQWRKMTKSSAAVVVVVPAVVSQISTDWSAKCSAVVGGLAANDNTFWHVSPARSAPAG